MSSTTITNQLLLLFAIWSVRFDIPVQFGGIVALWMIEHN